MEDYNSEKFKTVFSYILSRCKNKDKRVLCNLMYFSDFNFYEIYEKAITNETYMKFDKGILPSHFFDIEKEIYSKSLELSLLSTKELAVIDDVIDKLGNMSASEISKYTHGDTPWRIARNQQPLDYEYVFYRDEDYSVRVYDEDL